MPKKAEEAQQAPKIVCNPPAGFTCETHAPNNDNVMCHFYHNPISGDWEYVPLVQPQKESSFR